VLEDTKVENHLYMERKRGQWFKFIKFPSLNISCVVNSTKLNKCANSFLVSISFVLKLSRKEAGQAGVIFVVALLSGIS
jgi:hypothetical protein